MNPSKLGIFFVIFAAILSESDQSVVVLLVFAVCLSLVYIGDSIRESGEK